MSNQGRFTNPGLSPTHRVDARKRLDRERIELTETLTVDSFSPAIEFYRERFFDVLVGLEHLL